MKQYADAPTIFVILFILVMAMPVFATTEEAGKTAYATCIACHGDTGQGNAELGAPALAGQFEWYLDRQLDAFASGKRGYHKEDVAGQSMKPFAQMVESAATRQALLKYIETFAKPKSNKTLSGDMKNGSRYYQAKCGACHGDKAQGNLAFNAPALSNLSPSYLKLQMRNFASGIRGNQKDDKWGRQMAIMSRSVTDNQLDDILYFIQEQP